MTGDFKIEVPISVEGKAGGPKYSAKSSSALLGVSKALKSVVGKMAAVGVALAGIVGLLSKSSPYLKGILDIFGRSFMIFFRPFGDFLATLLRPMAILMMKMAIGFLKWTRTPAGKEVVGTAVIVGGVVTAVAVGSLASQAAAILGIGTAANLATGKVGSFMTKLKLLAGLGLITLGVKLAYDVLTSEEFGQAEVLKIIGSGLAIGLGATLLGASAATGITIGIITVTAIFAWKFIDDLKEKSKAYSALGQDIFRNEIQGPLGQEGQGTRITRQFSQDFPKVDFGNLGEISSSSQTVILNNSYNINGTLPEIDPEELARRFGRSTEMELKQRGIL